MSILVTGGAGYVGSAIVEHLVETGESVVCLDDLSTGHRSAVSGEVRLIEGCVLNEQLVLDTLRTYEVDAVVHCAGRSIVPQSNRQPLEYFENNVVGSHSLLKAMSVANVRRLVLSSSAAVYGSPESLPILETHPIAPLSVYGLTKRMIEEMLEWHARAHDFSYVSLRYFNAAGATERNGEDHNPETHLVPVLLDVASGNRSEVEVFGAEYATRDGSCVRDFVHVRDLATAHALAISHLRDGGESEVLNLGSGVGHTVFEVIAAVEEVTGHAVFRKLSAPREGDAESLVASIEKAASVLGWRPTQSDLAVLVSNAWAWKTANPGGYGK